MWNLFFVSNTFLQNNSTVQISRFPKVEWTAGFECTWTITRAPRGSPRGPWWTWPASRSTPTTAPIWTARSSRSTWIRSSGCCGPDRRCQLTAMILWGPATFWWSRCRGEPCTSWLRRSRRLVDGQNAFRRLRGSGWCSTRGQLPLQSSPAYWCSIRLIIWTFSKFGWAFFFIFKFSNISRN